MPVVWTGLTEEFAALEGLPETCLGEARKIVEGAANGAAADVRGQYGAHVYTGKLQESVEVTAEASEALGVLHIVKVRAPHAYIFENGTQVRQVTGKPLSAQRKRSYAARRKKAARLRGARPTRPRSTRITPATSLHGNRGSMPPGNIFVPAMVRARRRMFENLIDMLERLGAKGLV